MAYLANEDNNAYALGVAPPSPWTATPSTGGSILVDLDPEVGAPQGRVIRILDGSTTSGDTGRSRLRIGFATQTARLLIQFKIRFVQTDRQVLILPVNSLGNTFAFHRAHSDGHWQRFDSSFGYGDPTGSATYVANQWYSITIDYNPATANGVFAVDGVNKFSSTHGFSSVANLAGYEFQTADTETGGAFYIDDFKASPFFVTRTGIVRSAATGQILPGAVVLAINQATNTAVASATADAAGNFSISVPAPNAIDCVFVAFRNRDERGSARPWVNVF